MKKILALVVVVLVLGAVAFVGYRAGWFARRAPGASPGATPAGAPPAGAAPLAPGTPGAVPGGAAQPASETPGAAPSAPGTSGAATPTATSPSTASGGPESSGSSAPLIAVSAYTPFVDLASADLGGRIENARGFVDTSTADATPLIDGNPATAWWYGWNDDLEVHWILSFYRREPAVISGVVFNQAGPQSEWGTAEHRQEWVKDVEIWIAMDPPKDEFGGTRVQKGTPPAGFTKVAAASLRPEPGDQPVTFSPVEARFVTVRVLSRQATTGPDVILGKIRVMEGQRAGYVPLLARHPELAALKNGHAPWEDAARAALASASPSSTPGAAGGDVCAPVPNVAKTPPAHGESREILVVGPDAGSYRPATWANWAEQKPPEQETEHFVGIDIGLFNRIHATFVPHQLARPAMLVPVDTVALVGVCRLEIGLVSDVFKRALAGWVAAGHKLIIQDSDWCSSQPDYGFLPYPFATSNPGAQGASSDRLLFVEENTIGNGQRGDPAFLDLGAWLGSAKGSFNELGDSNTIVQYDPHWCGHLFGTNALKKNGFMEAYAHYGRGLIIYHGFDEKEDQGQADHNLLTRELAQPFDPDGLPCAAPLGDFVITTAQRLRTQTLVPGKRYEYPLTLLSNQGYAGRVKLTGASDPAAPGLSLRFEPDTIELTEISEARLTVATAATTPVRDHVLTVRGTDAAGKTNTLCLSLGPARTGSLQVVSALPRPRRPSKNLEIILDASGSMKTPLGKSTRMATAREVLRSVVARIPDDFNVGLRFYGHRYGSRQKETCTDSELVRPIEPLDRADLLAKVDAVQPRGETPLIYSVLQTPADLKDVGGGSVILVTDGEESCGGDAPAAAKQLKAAGIDVTLNIVGFTLKGKAVEQQLSALAESTGGRYYSAQSGEALAQALLIAAIERIPYTVFDASGKQVVTGEAGGPGEELAPGEYRVVVSVGDQQLVAQKVSVAAGGSVILKVVVKNDRLAIER